MTKNDFKYLIEIEKYQFELKYQKDFRSIIVASAGLFILILELFLRQEIFLTKSQIILILLGISIVVVISVGFYLAMRSVFLRRIKYLLKKLYEQNY